MTTDEQFMQRALELAREAEQAGEVPVGAVIVSDNKIIAEAFNSPIKDSDPTAHAEVNVIRKAAQIVQNYRLVNTTLYVTLEPCAMCVGAMVHARISRCVYAASDPKSGAVCSALSLVDQSCFNHRIDCHGGVLAEPCAELLKAFFKAKR